MSDMPAETIRISQATIDDTFMAIGELDFTSFRDAEYGRLAEQRDPAEQLIKEAFAILIARVGEQDARRFMVGSLLLTRSLYVEAAAQGLTIRRLDVLMVGTQVEAIAQAFDPRRSFDLDDIYDEFPDQGPLCVVRLMG